MYVEFDQLPPGARIWVYTASAPITAAQEQHIRQKTKTFFTQWNSHGKDLKGSCRILSGHFLVLGADSDYQMPSGCSIDKTVALVRELEQELDLVLTDHSRVALRTEDDNISLVRFQEIKNQIQAGQIRPDTPVFNTSLQSRAELDTAWIPAEKSWLGRYFS